MSKNLSFIGEEIKEELIKDNRIGRRSLEAFLEIIEKYRSIIKNELEDVQKYMAIGTVEECLAASEKQITKEVIDNTTTDDDCWYQCPTCGGDLTRIRGLYCIFCGQKLKW